MSDVVVVGGGPVGVTTALLLAGRGFSVRVLERAREVYDLPRAIVMDDEIQRVFQGAGLVDELRSITTPIRGAEFVRADGERIMGLELPPDVESPLGHPPSTTYYQPELETMLRRAAIDAGVELCLGVEVTSVAATGAGVAVTADDGRHEARWSVAADGAASPVRKQLGIAFVDHGFDQDWLVLDVRLRRPVPTLSPFVQQICDPARPTTYVPGHADYRRWEFQLQPGESREDMTSERRVWELLEPWIGPDDAEVVRAVVYRFHATVAAAMRSGPIFLAGDAAHQMPPFLGQGLCSGIRDAANLAWKLRLVADGTARDGLLDTYGAERLPHAAGVVAHAVDTGKLIDELSGRAPASIGLDAAYGGGRPFPTLEHGIRVGDHPAVGRQLPQPEIDGQRLDELLGPGFAIVADEAHPAPIAADRLLGGLARAVTVPTGALPLVLAPGAAAVVRPDRYVAAIASGPTELAAACDTLLDRLCVDTRRTERS
jgi:3-(3-hydroxy-phenyl)propionate hydroxylase